jgi:hypothetical protein
MLLAGCGHPLFARVRGRAAGVMHSSSTTSPPDGIGPLLLTPDLSSPSGACPAWIGRHGARKGSDMILLLMRDLALMALMVALLVVPSPACTLRGDEPAQESG